MMNLFSKSPKNLGKYLNRAVIVSQTIVTSNQQGRNRDVMTESMYKFFAQAKSAWISSVASVNDFFHSYTWKEIFFTIKVISFILSLLMLLAIIYIFLKKITMKAAAKPEKTDRKKKKNIKKWAKIEKKFDSEMEANYKLAILEADNFYDENLKALGYEKEKELSNVDEIKKAKRIKNKIIDDPDCLLTKDEARLTLNAYKKGLEELGVV